MNNLPIFSEGDVRQLVNMQDAIRAVERGLRAEAAALAETLPKYVLPYDNNERALHVIGAVAPGLGISGVKSWVQHHATAHPVILLFDSASTTPLALIEAGTLSNLRTGALAGVASKYLAVPNARVLGVIGSGKQARSLVEAVAAVRSLERVKVWSPNPVNRERFVDYIRQALGLEAVAADTPDQALEKADIVGLTARVSQPVVTSDMLSPGTHINSIGITVAGKSELPQEVFPRVSQVCADSVASVRASSDEFRAFYGNRQDWQALQRLGDIVRTGQQRDRTADLTVYKGMGTGVADLALAALILEKAGLLNP